MSPPSDATPLVSIALATYNGGAYLDAQMASLRAQSGPSFEIVVSDGGSSDGTVERLAELATQDARIRLLPAAGRLGFNDNFMRCFAACRGAFISPCDQDDLWQPDKTARLLAACQAGDGAAYCDSEFIDPAGQRIAEGGAWRLSQRKRMHSDPDALRLLFDNCVSGHALMFPSRLLCRVAEIPSQGYFDWSLAFAARLNGLSLTYIDAPLVAYRRHPSAVTVRKRHVRRPDRKAALWALRWAMLNTALERADPQSPEVARLRTLVAAFAAWWSAWCGLPLLRALWPQRHHISPGKGALAQALAVLGLCAGYRLRATLRPRRYPAVREVGRQIHFEPADDRRDH